VDYVTVPISGYQRELAHRPFAGSEDVDRISMLEPKTCQDAADFDSCYMHENEGPDCPELSEAAAALPIPMFSTECYPAMLVVLNLSYDVAHALQYQHRHGYNDRFVQAPVDG
jgi:hypothetical protein